VRAAREAFLSGDRDPKGVRPQVLASWRRCELNGVNPDRLAIPHTTDFEPESKLYRIAKPILDRFAERLLDTRSSLILADRQARVLKRWAVARGPDNLLERLSVVPGCLITEEVAGTNGLGTALEEARPVQIVGGEHFAEQFQAFTCVGSPIRHPITRHIAGLVNLACGHKDTNALILPMVTEIASEIERELYLHASEGERALLESFLREARTSSRAIVSMSEQVVMANVAATRVLEGADQAVLWEQASRAAAQRSERSILLTLADGRSVQARCKPVDIGSHSVGVLVELFPEVLAHTSTGRRGAVHATVGAPNSLVGQSSALRQIEAKVRQVASSGLPILFLGELGTGKATLAAYAHQCSGVEGDFTIFDAVLAQVDGAQAWLHTLRERLAQPNGTVLLRHLAALEPTTVAAVCSLIDLVPEGVGPRLMATSVADTALEPGAFQPLLDRIGVARITIPPLRQRPGDIKGLVAEFVHRFAPAQSRPRLAPEALQALLRLDWPGNLRQLETLIRELVSGGQLSQIRLEDLPEHIRRQTARRRLSRLEQMELDQIIVALREARGNKFQAAKALGISRSTLHRKLRVFGIELDRSIF
jgi:transcriptional regulator of acetoin/glycerol metabolism